MMPAPIIFPPLDPIRRVTGADVETVQRAGRTIETYPADTPFPSYLVLGWQGNRPIHVVGADDVNTRRTVIITVYEPDAGLWNSAFTTRR
jgi:hypothetical protein